MELHAVEYWPAAWCRRWSSEENAVRRRSAEHLLGLEPRRQAAVEHAVVPGDADATGDQDRDQIRLPQHAFVGVRIDERALRIRRQGRTLGQRTAERDVDPGQRVDRPAVRVEQRAEVAPAQ